MRFAEAIARRPGRSFASGLTSGREGVPDVDRALEQHGHYCDALTKAGLMVNVLPPLEAHPDSTFVEDTAVIVKMRALATRPGAASRLGEVESIRFELGAYFNDVDRMEEPATLDGGDVCDAGDTVYVGLSHRTNEAGIRQLERWLAPAGIRTVAIEIRDMPSILHLKSGMAYLGDGRFVATQALAARLQLSRDAVVLADDEEAYAANCVRVNDVVLFPAGYPRLQRQLENRGYALRVLDVSEFRKMDGGLSCLSLRF